MSPTVRQTLPDRVSRCRRVAEILERGSPQDHIAEIRHLTRGASWLDFLRGQFSLHADGQLPEADYMVRAAGSVQQYTESVSGLVNVFLLDGFTSLPDPYQGIAAEIPLSNFLESKLLSVDEPPVLQRLARGSTARMAHVSGSVEGWKLFRCAAQWRLDEMDLLDNSAIDIQLQFSRELGRQAKRVQTDLLASLILENPTLDADSTSVFDSATHGNLGSDALGSTGLRTAVSAVAGQTLEDADGRPVHLGLLPKYLLVPPSLLGVAGECTVSYNEVSGELIDTINYVGSAFSPRFKPIRSDRNLIVRCDSRLGATGCVDPRTGAVRTGSDTSWFCFSSGDQGPTLCFGGLNGRTDPRVSSYELGQGEWGVGLQMSMDIAAAWAGYAGGYQGNV